MDIDFAITGTYTFNRNSLVFKTTLHATKRMGVSHD